MTTAFEINHSQAKVEIKSFNERIFKQLKKQISHYDVRNKNNFKVDVAAQDELFINCKTNNKPDPTFYRKAFLNFLQQNLANMPHLTGAQKRSRETDPEHAAISMQDFFTKKGLELYRLALEEEANSREYRNAVLLASTKYYAGKKWAERPIVIVAGPSACGKTFSASAAVKKCIEFLPKKNPYQNTGNFVITVDGGILRETSQIRKIAIQTANLHGFSGLKDIQHQSNVLDKTKQYIKNTALKSQHGIVIPETFSKPFSGNILRTADKLPNTKLIFTRIEGEHPSLFQRIVAFMGKKRAWKTNGFDKKNSIIDLDLNRKNVVESKAYDKRGFFFGMLGSKIAELWYNLFSKHKLSMVITNDLIALKPDKKLHKWIPADHNDKNAALVSSSTYQKWLALSDADKTQTPLLDMPRMAPKIQTSVQIDIAIIIENVCKEINNMTTKTMSCKIKLDYLKTLKSSLENINDDLNLENLSAKQKEIRKLTSEVKCKIVQFASHHVFGFFYDHTKGTLRDTLNKLGDVQAKLAVLRANDKVYEVKRPTFG